MGGGRDSRGDEGTRGWGDGGITRGRDTTDTRIKISHSGGMNKKEHKTKTKQNGSTMILF